MDDQTQSNGVNFGEGNKIDITGDVFGGDKVFGDKITIGAIGSINVQYYPIKLRAPLRKVFDPLIEDRTKLFGGRDAVLTRIAEFIQNPEGGYLVITAPAGFGKTALLANLVSRTPNAFVYHFFTSFYDHNPDSLGRDEAATQPTGRGLPDSLLSEKFFLRNVIEQIAQWHGHQELLPDELNELRALYHKFIEQPLKGTQILVLDGLDEVTRWKLDFYLSRKLPRNLHLIVTLRDVGQDWQAEYQFPANRLTHLPLDGFSRDEIVQVLHAAGGNAITLANNPLVLNEIMKKAVSADDVQLGADPFYVRLLAEDAAKGLLTVANITQQPQGLNNYLKRWLEAVIKIGETSENYRDAVIDLLGTLIVAQGPIPRIELETINPSLATSEGLSRIFPKVIQQVRRFVKGEDDVGYKLMHPRLSRYMRTHPDINVDTYVDRVLTYCKRWSEHKSPYALAYCAQHLKNAGQREVLYKLIDKPWMEVKFQQTFSHRAFAEDVDLAIEVAAADESSNGLVQLVRNCLIYGTLSASVSNLPPELLGVLVQVGYVARALDYAALMQGAQKSQAYAAISQALLKKENKPLAKELLEKALQIAEAESSYEQAIALVHVIAVMAQAGEFERASTLIGQLPDDIFRIPALSALAQAMAQAGEQRRAAAITNQALQATKTRPSLVERLCDVLPAIASIGEVDNALQRANVIDDPGRKVEALAKVAQVMAQSGEKDRAARIIEQALSMAKTMRHEAQKSEKMALYSYPAKSSLIRAEDALGWVAQAMARVGEFERALALIEETKYQRIGAEALIGVAQALAGAGQQQRARKIANDVLWQLEWPDAKKLAKTKLLKRMAQALAQAGSFGSALRIVQTVDPIYKGEALSTMAQAMRCVRSTNILKRIFGWGVGWVLGNFSQAQERFKNRIYIWSALGEIQAMADEAEKAEYLKHVIEVMKRESQANDYLAKSARRALELAKTIQDKESQTQILSDIATIMARGGEFDHALSIVQTRVANANTAWRIAYSLDVISEAIAQAGEFRRALQVADTIEDEACKVDALCRIARVLIQRGKKQQALNITDSATVIANKFIVEGKERSFCEITKVVAQAGEFDHALSLVETWPTLKSEALSGIAQAIGQAGEFHRALTVAETIEDKSHEKIKALIAIAQAIARTGDKQWAADVANQAIVIMKIPPTHYYLIHQEELEQGLEILLQAGHYKSARQAFCTILIETSHAPMPIGHTTREGVFRILESGAPLLAAIDQGHTLERVYEAIMEVDGWWWQDTTIDSSLRTIATRFKHRPKTLRLHNA